MKRNTARRVSPVLLAVVAAGIMLAGCSSPNGPSGSLGTVTGTLRAVGGSSGASPQALAGEIILQGPNGKFSFDAGVSASVPVGTYTVTGRSPQYEGGNADCTASAPVIVTKGVKSSVVVDCQEK